MFSVYGASGRLFRGTLEQLRQITPVHAADRTRAVEPIWRDASVAAAAAAPRQPEGEPARQRGAALAAYARPQPPPGQRWSRLTAGSYMSRDVFLLSDTDTVPLAWQLLDQERLGQAPVVNADGVLVGMVTLTRLAALYTGGLLAQQAPRHQAVPTQTLADCMLTPVPSVSAEADLRRVAGLLLESALPGLPVVDEDGRVTGFVSRSDVLRAVLDDTAVDQWG